MKANLLYTYIDMHSVLVSIQAILSGVHNCQNHPVNSFY